MRGKVAKRLREIAMRKCLERRISPGQDHNKYLRHTKTGQIICKSIFRQFYKSLKKGYYHVS